MAMNLQSPLAQSIISIGRQRGYNPMSIAASLGNGFVENGLNTSGRPGDNGTAFGGFQWRNERKAALDALAQKMGKTWDDPMVQGTHWWDEQDGSESRWGLKNANSIEGANRAAISSLRPAGWTSQNPEAGHAYGNRLRATQEAFAQLNGGQMPQGAQGASAGFSGDPRADMPVEGAQEVSFNVPQPPKEGWDAFLDGGPGALFGKPQEGWNIGDALSGAGIAMMARDNPTGAAALASYLKTGKKDNSFETKIDTKSGKAYVTDNKGNVTVKQVSDPAPADNYTIRNPETNELVTYDGKGNVVNRTSLGEKPAKPMTDASRKLFQSNNDGADVAYKAVNDNNRFIQLLMDGKVDLSASGRLGNTYSNYLNDSDEKTRNAALLQQHLENLRNARLLEAKGVQTEGDAERAMNTLLPGGARYDNKAVASLLRELNGDFQNRFETNSRYNDSILSKYKDEDPDGFYKKRFEERSGSLKNSKTSIDSRWDDFIKSKPAPSNPEPTGRNPVTTPQKPRGSFLNFFDGK